MVSQIGLASGCGVPAASIEKAFHEYGINYLYVSPILNLSNMVKAIRNLAPSHRDELLIVMARPFFGGFGGYRLEKFVERWLKKLKLEWTDLLFQDVRKPLSQKLIDRLQRLRASGKLRSLGMSSRLLPLRSLPSRCERLCHGPLYRIADGGKFQGNRCWTPGRGGDGLRPAHRQAYLRIRLK